VYVAGGSCGVCEVGAVQVVPESELLYESNARIMGVVKAACR
jgi:hypothetical protein